MVDSFVSLRVLSVKIHVLRSVLQNAVGVTQRTQVFTIIASRRGALVSWLWLIELGWLGTAIIPGGEGGMSPLDGRTAEPSSYPAPSAADADALAAVGAEACNVGAEDGGAAAGDAVTRNCALGAASEPRVAPSAIRRVHLPAPPRPVRGPLPRPPPPRPAP